MKTLVVFARWPEPGRVKTRLSPALPSPLACELQRAMLHDTLEAARAAQVDRRMLAWAEAPATTATMVPGFEVVRQRGDDLGARLESTFADGFESASGPVVICGSDAPELSTGTLDAAFVALTAHDLVLGPTPDGGFYLLGLARPAPGLLEGIPWSTPDVLRATEARARASGRSLATLTPIADVDTPRDLVELIGRSIASPRGTFATARALASMGLLPSES